MILIAIALLIAAIFVFLKWFHGEDLSRFDRGYPAAIAGNPPSAAAESTLRQVEAFVAASGGELRGRQKLAALRAAMDAVSKGRSIISTITPVSDSVRGEWVVAPGANSAQRLLYIHGGGFVAGSPVSHRAITDALSRETAMAVFALDYRLLPEHSRMDGLSDCLSALRWICEEGPDGAETASQVVVAGDSAGGSLTLATLQRARDAQMRMPDAAIALCPTTDVTLRSPSLVFNRDSDPMLGKSFGALTKVPTVPRHLLLGFMGRRPPANPALSPLRGDLTGLPPILLQVSLSEMLLDDAARYYHRARDAGAVVELETYDNMVHVWHLFYPDLPEAQCAVQRIREFLMRSGVKAARVEDAPGGEA